MRVWYTHASAWLFLWSATVAWLLHPHTQLVYHHFVRPTFVNTVLSTINDI